MHLSVELPTKLHNTQDVWTTPAGCTRAVWQCTEKMKASTDRMEAVSFRRSKNISVPRVSIISKGYNGCKQTTSQCPYLWDSHGCTLFSFRRGNDTNVPSRLFRWRWEFIPPPPPPPPPSQRMRSQNYPKSRDRVSSYKSGS